MTIKTREILEYVSTLDLTTFIRLDNDYGEEESLVESLERAAISKVENITGRTIHKSKYTVWYRYFPNSVELLHPPVISVTAVKYYQGGVLKTLDASKYRLLNTQPVQTLLFSEFPSVDDRVDAVQIEYTTGYTSLSVPDEVSTAVRLLVSELYDKHEISESVEKAVRYLVSMLDTGG